MHHRLAGLVAALVLLVSACTGPAASPAQSPPTRSADSVTDTDARADHPGRHTDDAVRTRDLSALCGTLQVLEDRSNPSGRRIGLNVAVIPAVATVPKADPLFPLDGGPGQAATEDLGWTASVFAGVHADRDIVLVDQRGTGGSNRLAAPESPDIEGLPEAEATAIVEAWLKQVLAEMPGDPRFYTTSAAMDDLDEVRAAPRLRQDQPVRAVVRRDCRPVLHPPARRPRPNGRSRWRHPPRRTDLRAHRPQQPARPGHPVRPMRADRPAGRPSRTSKTNSPR